MRAHTPPSPIYVSIRQIAGDLGISRNTVRRLLSSAGVRAFVLSDARNGTIRYLRADVHRWLQAQRERD